MQTQSLGASAPISPSVFTALVIQMPGAAIDPPPNPLKRRGRYPKSVMPFWKVCNMAAFKAEALRCPVVADPKPEVPNDVANAIGEEAAKASMELSMARFKVGDQALYFKAGAEYGEVVRIVHAYDFYTVTEPDGEYLYTDGSRVDYKFGYIIQTEAGNPFWVPPHRLTRDDCQPSYLCLTHQNTAQRQGVSA